MHRFNPFLQNLSSVSRSLGFTPEKAPLVLLRTGFMQCSCLYSWHDSPQTHTRWHCQYIFYTLLISPRETKRPRQSLHTSHSHIEAHVCPACIGGPSMKSQDLAHVGPVALPLHLHLAPLLTFLYVIANVFTGAKERNWAGFIGK